MSIDYDAALDKMVEHVRAAHTTLVIICFGLTLTAALARRPDVDQAYEHLSEIARAAKLWSTDPRWLDRYANTAAAADIQQATEFIAADLRKISIVHEIPEDEGGDSHRHTLSRRLWTIRDQRYQGVEPLSLIDTASGEPMTAWDALYLNAPQNIHQFRRYWDAFAEPVKIYVPAAIPRQVIHGSTVSDISEAPPGSKSLPVRRPLVFAPLSKATVSTAAKPIYGDVTVPGNVLSRSHCFVQIGHFDDALWQLAILPTETTVIHQMHAQDAFNKVFRTQFDLGSSEEVFPNLLKLTEPYQDLPFARALKILEAERRRSDTAFEVGGVKLPVDKIGQWGALVIAILQLYLLLTMDALSALRSRQPSASSSVPWLGFYDSVVAQGLTFATIVSPAIAVCLLAYWSVMSDGTPERMEMTFGTGIVVISAVASWFSSRLLIMLRRSGGDTASATA